jgi:LPS export ABC transporter protein LptC
MRHLLLIALITFFIACSGDTSQIDSLYDEDDVSTELVKDLQMTYSDSARVMLKVSSPLLQRRERDSKITEEFPEGLYVEFYQGGFRPSSWLKADHGFRDPEQKKIILRGNVQLFNDKNDKLETAELYWYQDSEEINTEKFVRITQPSKGDTTYGFGFSSDQHFNRFEIKRKFSGKIEESMMGALKED